MMLPLPKKPLIIANDNTLKIELKKAFHNIAERFFMLKYSVSCNVTKAKSNFKAILGRFNSNLWHFHVPVLLKYATPFIDGKDKRVICTLQKTATFQAALMPMGNGDYFINVNKKLRDSLKLNEGDEVLVSLEKDTSEYGLPVPDEFVELLKQDSEGNDIFHQLTPGKQRTLIYIVAKPKAADLRIRNGIVILEHLKRNKGVIHYKQLGIEMKNS